MTKSLRATIDDVHYLEITCTEWRDHCSSIQYSSSIFLFSKPRFLHLHLARGITLGNLIEPKLGGTSHMVDTCICHLTHPMLWGLW